MPPAAESESRSKRHNNFGAGSQLVTPSVDEDEILEESTEEVEG